MKKGPPELTKFKTPEGLWCGWFYDECWRVNCHILWGLKKDKQVHRFVKRVFGLEYERPFNSCLARCLDVNTPNTRAQVIVIKNWEWTAHGMDALSHEALHATHNVLRDRGMRLNDETEEAYAYLLGSIVRRALIILNQ